MTPQTTMFRLFSRARVRSPRVHAVILSAALSALEPTARAAHHDPAPLPDQVVHPGGQKARTATAADTLRHQLNELSAPVHQGTTGGDSVSRTQRMLLAGKRNELSVVRAQLIAEFGQTRA